MIIDDESYNCEVLKSMLLFINPNFIDKLVICMSGKEAIDKLKEATYQDGEHFSCEIGLIFTDLSMPMMDGY